MSQPRPTPASPGSPFCGLLERLADPPTKVGGVVWAFVAFAMMLVGLILVPWIVSVVVGVTDQVALVRWYLSGNILGLLAFLPLLRAVHAVIGTRSIPAWTMAAAYAVLLVRPLTLVPEVISAPLAVLSNLGPLSLLLPYLLLATTGIAAGIAAWGVLPLAQEAASPGRRAAVAVGVGLLVALALFSFAPYIAPLGALGVAVALLLRRGANGPAGQD